MNDEDMDRLLSNLRKLSCSREWRPHHLADRLCSEANARRSQSRRRRVAAGGKMTP
jgi:hypothetical protein